MTSTAVVLAFCRFGLDAAALLLFGSSAYLAWLVPRPFADEVAARTGRATAAAVLVALVSTVARLPVEVATIGDGWRDAVDPTQVIGVLQDTSVGQAWTAQAAAATLLALVQAVPARWRLTATAPAAGLLLASQSLGGHAAMHEGPLGLLHRANDAAHLLCAGAWLGALWPVLVILNRDWRSERRHEARAALQAFSRAGHVAVALVLATGTLNAALVLGRWPTEPSSPYQTVLDLKVLCTAAMVALALINRYLVVPRLNDRRGAAANLRRATLVEIALGLLVVALVATLGHMDPT